MFPPAAGPRSPGHAPGRAGRFSELYKKRIGCSGLPSPARAVLGRARRVSCVRVCFGFWFVFARLVPPPFPGGIHLAPPAGSGSGNPERGPQGSDTAARGIAIRRAGPRGAFRNSP